MSQTITRQRSFTSADATLHQHDSAILETTPTRIQKTQHSVVNGIQNVLDAHKTAQRSVRWIIINLVCAFMFYMEL